MGMEKSHRRQEAQTGHEEQGQGSCRPPHGPGHRPRATGGHGVVEIWGAVKGVEGSEVAMLEMGFPIKQFIGTATMSP